MDGVGRFAKQFEAVFTGVARPRNHAGNVGDGTFDEGVVLHTAELGSRQPLHQADGSRALHANQCPVVADVEDAPTLPSPRGGGRLWLPCPRGGRRLGVRLDPVEVAILVGGVHHQQVAAVGYRIDQDIIDDAAVGIAQQRVLDPAGGKRSEVAREDALGQALIVDAQLAHVREIEEADPLPHGPMLLADAAVLERHHPTAEVRHLGAESDMLLVQRGPLGRHDQTLRLVKVAHVVEVVKVVEQFLVVHIARLPQHPEHDVDPRLLPLQKLGELGRRRRAPQPLGKEALRRLQQAAGDYEGLVVALGFFRLGEDIIHGGGNGMDEAGVEGAVARLVVLHCRDQAHGPLLKQVAKRDAPIPARVSGLQDQVQVVLDQDPVGFVAFWALLGKELAFLTVGQAWVARELRPDLLLLIAAGP